MNQQIKHYEETGDFLMKIKKYQKAERSYRAAQNHFGVYVATKAGQKEWNRIQNKLIEAIERQEHE